MRRPDAHRLGLDGLGYNPGEVPAWDGAGQFTPSTPSGVPGGADTQVQFNDAGAFGGDAGLVFDKATGTLSIGAILALGPAPRASTGAVRWANGTEVRVRNVGDTQDIQALVVYTDNKVYVGAFANDAGLVLRSTTGISVNQGITFPAVQVASAGANDFDDYEEGNWTPTLTSPAGNAGIGITASGYYRKWGSAVFANGLLQLAAKGALAGALQIGGLPFASQAATHHHFSGVSYFSGLATAVSCIMPFVNANSIVADLNYIAAAGGTAHGALAAADVTAALDLRFGMLYAAAA